MSEQSNQLEILGQKISYPNNWPGCASVLIVAVAMVAIVYIIAKMPSEKIQTLREVFVSGVATSRGLTSDDEYYRLGFWTPSPQTTGFWQAWQAESPGRQLHHIDQWEIAADNAARVKEFGEILNCRTCPAVDYRRFDVVGKGSAEERPGYWWVATIRTEVSVAEFVGMYSGFWGSSDSVYVEVTRTAGGKFKE